MATVIDSYSQTNQDSISGALATGGFTTRWAQCFTGDGQKIVDAKWYVQKHTGPTGNAVAKIYAMTGTFGTSGVATGSALATSDNVDVSTLGSLALVTFPFSGANQYVTTNGTKYVVSIEYSGGNASNYLELGYDGSSSTHPGNISYWDGSNWVAIGSAIDFCFYVDGVPAVVDVTVNLTGVSGSPAIGTGTIGVVGAFNPASISGLTVWLKADSLLVSDGGPVSPWTDMSGNGNDGVVTATPDPKVRTNALNGLPVVRFNYNEGRIRGDTDLLLSGLPAPGYNYSILYIGRMVGPNVGRIFAGTYPATNFLVGFHSSSVDVTYDGAFIGPVVGYPAGTPTPWKQYSYTASHDGTNYDSDYYINGTTIGGLSTGSGLQARYNLSGYDATGNQETCDCEVAELLIYNHKLSDADRITVEQYLDDKWFNVVLTGVAADPQIGAGTVEITVGIAPPSTGGGTGAGRPSRTGMRLRPTEDKFVYLKGVAADPKVGQVMLLSEMAKVYEAYSLPIRRAEARTPAKMPPGLRQLFKPVEKPIPPALFVYQVGLPKLRSAVGTGKVNAFYEDIDEETIAMIDLL